MNKVIAFLFLVTVLLASPIIKAQNVAETSVTLYTTELSAQQHCPSDTVVWLNTKSGVYHFKGQRWYGKTKNGAYVCQSEANKVGDRPTQNGQ